MNSRARKAMRKETPFVSRSPPSSRTWTSTASVGWLLTEGGFPVAHPPLPAHRPLPTVDLAAVELLGASSDRRFLGKSKDAWKCRKTNLDSFLDLCAQSVAVMPSARAQWLAPRLADLARKTTIGRATRRMAAATTLS